MKILKYKFKVLIVAIVLVLIASSVFIGGRFMGNINKPVMHSPKADKYADYNNTEKISVPSAVIENDRIKLSVSSEGSFSVLDKESGREFFSRSEYAENDKYSSGLTRQKMMSELQISYYNKKTALISDISNNANVDEAAVTLYTMGEDIVASYDFKSYSIKFDVVYSLGEDYLSAAIISESIEESGEYALSSISLLPALFSASGDDNGVIFVPDGSGALINFNNECTVQYEASVYGEDVSFDKNTKTSYDKKINIPVYGMVKNSFGMMAVIEEGEAFADITAASKNATDYYNYVYSTAVIRKSYEKSMFAANDKAKSSAKKQLAQIPENQNFIVRYYFLGENTDYVSMAGKYREYLINEKRLEKNISKPSLNIELIGAIDVKANFMGFTYYDIKSLTTYKQAEAVLSELKESGIDNLTLKYSGWNKDGITNKNVLKSMKLEGRLGDKKSFDSLNGFAEKNGIKIDYDIEMFKFYNGADKYKVSSPFNEEVIFSRYLRSVYAKDINKRSWYLLSPLYIENNFSSILKSTDKLGIKNIALSAFSNSLYSDYKNKKEITRTEMMNEISYLLNKSGLTVSGEEANAYTFPYFTKIYSSPTYSSGYRVFDEEVPFYQIVLHGYVDMTNELQYTSNDQNVNYLRAVESGIQLYYQGISNDTSSIVDTDYDYLYGTSFDTWKKEAIEKYNEYQPLLNKIYDMTITEHNKLQPDVYETVYENGVSVIVNYNSYSVSVDGIEISAYGFCERG